MAGGRPTKYKKAYCKLAIDIMSKGESIAGLAAEIGVPRQRLYEWAKDHPEFHDALEVARSKSQRFYEKLVLLHATGQHKNDKTLKNSSLLAINFVLNKRFRDYHDKKVEMQENDIRGDIVYRAEIQDGGYIGFTEDDENSPTESS